MRHYELRKFYVCQLTGAALIEEQLQLPNAQPTVNVLPFSTEDNAWAYINRHKKDWLWSVLITWLKHKEQIFKNNGEQEKFTKASAFIELFDLNIPAKALSTVCKSVIDRRADLTNLLPSENNTSYESSTKALQEILTFCEKNKP